MTKRLWAEDSDWRPDAAERSPGSAPGTTPSDRRHVWNPDRTATATRRDRRPGDHANRRFAIFRCAIRRWRPRCLAPDAAARHTRPRAAGQWSAESPTRRPEATTPGARPRARVTTSFRAPVPVAAGHVAVA